MRFPWVGVCFLLPLLSFGEEKVDIEIDPMGPAIPQKPVQVTEAQLLSHWQIAANEIRLEQTGKLKETDQQPSYRSRRQQDFRFDKPTVFMRRDFGKWEMRLMMIPDDLEGSDKFYFFQIRW